MGQKSISKATRDAVLKAWKETGESQESLADRFGIGQGSVSKILRGQKRDELIIEAKPSKRDLANKVIDDNAQWHKEKFEHGLERLKRWIGDTAAPKVRASALKKSAVISFVANDLHAPFMNEEAFGRAIREAKAAGATQAIIPGDLMDQFAVSRYPKTRQKFSLVEEFQHSRAVVRTLAENFENVILMHGNHDERFLKFLVSHGMPPDVLDFFRLAHPTALSPLAKLASDFPNVKMFDVPRCGNAEYHHLAQLGDCVFSHSERFSIIPGKATADVLHFLKKKLEPMGVIKPFRVLIQAHTHCFARFAGDYGVLCIENGTLSQIPDYDGSPKLMGRQPTLGYTLMTQRNGITDRNATQFYEIEG